jgi:hypothetical protein
MAEQIPNQRLKGRLEGRGEANGYTKLTSSHKERMNVTETTKREKPVVL